MDFCFNCGSETDADWVFCRSCGSGLDVPEGDPTPAIGTETQAAPQVELISRRWDVVDIDTDGHPTDPLDDDVIDVPLQPGAIEISADDVTVVETPVDPSPAGEEPAGDDVMAAPKKETDSWDHLRPHSHATSAAEPATAAAAAGQISLLAVALAALVATALRFYLNTRLDGFGDGTVSSRTVSDVETVADASLIVMLGLIAIAAVILGWWIMTRLRSSSFHPGSAGIVALTSAVGGAALLSVFYFSKNETVAEAIGANSLIILGLGLVMMSCLATIRAMGRVEETS